MQSVGIGVVVDRERLKMARSRRRKLSVNGRSKRRNFIIRWSASR
jgi:hypothetical protein